MAEETGSDQYPGSDAETGVNLEKVKDRRKLFFQLLKGFPVLLNKSQATVIMDAKHKALEDLSAALQKITKKTYTTAQIQKRVANMKQLMKNKTMEIQKGNKRLKLEKWEQEFLELFSDQLPNCSISRTSGRVTGRKREASDAESDTEMKPDDHTIDLYSDNGNDPLSNDHDPDQDNYPSETEEFPEIPPPARRIRLKAMIDLREKPNLLEAAETDATRKLTTVQLSRLVLLEKYKLIKMKQKRISAQAKAFREYFDADDD